MLELPVACCGGPWACCRRCWSAQGSVAPRRNLGCGLVFRRWRRSRACKRRCRRCCRVRRSQVSRPMPMRWRCCRVWRLQLPRLLRAAEAMFSTLPLAAVVRVVDKGEEAFACPRETVSLLGLPLGVLAANGIVAGEVSATSVDCGEQKPARRSIVNSCRGLASPRLSPVGKCFRDIW